MTAADSMPAALGPALSAAVPLYILSMTSLTDDERITLARECSQVIASHGDDIMFRSHKKGKTAQAFDALARGLAAAAYQPGGITFAGLHWCTDHDACQAAEAAAWTELRRAADQAEDTGP